ncbi:SRPBCC domain-containing protein [Microbacterium panaciterrae]|uniref:Metalloregulator ArsR/SmtB family transcription factor n=1 Tax=Microbacterium panaciterrae TaxID=985759 RepID=A0ABP8PK01_9MICO
MRPSASGRASGEIDLQRAFAALGEPTRFRVVEVLAESARTVGGVADAIGALQPQTTKHLQALEVAGLIVVHKLGRRRVARLDRAAFALLSAWLGAWAQEDPDDVVLGSYEHAIAEAEADPARPRALSLSVRIDAPIDAVWRAWTDPQLAARWWVPRHFEVRGLEIGPNPGAPVRVALAEPGGAIYRSEGRVLDVDPGRRLAFALAPLDEAGEALFDAVHTVELREEGAATVVELRIEAEGARPGVAEALAGLEPGWSQLLDNLAALLGGDAPS